MADLLPAGIWKLKEEVFTYRETKDSKVFIYWHGKQVTILSKKKAQKFLAKMKNATFLKQQLLMAKETGNFKRGNER